MKDGSNRIAGIDIIKTLAILFVVCVHFSLNTKYYITPVSDLNMYFQTVIRWLFIICVPLFILSTGYLNHKKTVSKSYYLKLARVLIPYLVISILCLIVKEWKSPDPIDWKNDIYSVFNFTADPYSWYVNMFIGLYLIAPFLNTLVNALERKTLLVLIGILLIIVSLPITFDPIFSVEKLSWFYFPDFWQSIYPLIYYFIGAYIAKYTPSVNKLLCASAAFGLVLLQTVILILAQPYLDNNWLLSQYGSIFMIAESVFIFLLLYNTDIKSRPVRLVIKVISSVTLEIYLFSYLIDSYIYPYFYGLNTGITQEQFFKKYFIVIVPIVFVSSFVMAFVFHLIYEQTGKVVKRLVKKREKVLQDA